MPPQRWSRHIFSAGYVVDGVRRLAERERYGYHNFPDNRIHVVQDGDTLEDLAERYFAGMPRACGLWWVIADFQPAPIQDPTLALQAGATLIIPSLRTVQEEVFNARRRSEAVP